MQENKCEKCLVLQKELQYYKQPKLIKYITSHLNWQEEDVKKNIGVNPESIRSYSCGQTIPQASVIIAIQNVVAPEYNYDYFVWNHEQYKIRNNKV